MNSVEIKNEIFKKEAMLVEWERALVHIASNAKEEDSESIWIELHEVEQEVKSQELKQLVLSLIYFVEHNQHYLKKEVYRNMYDIRNGYIIQMNYLKSKIERKELS